MGSSKPTPSWQPLHAVVIITSRIDWILTFSHDLNEEIVSPHADVARISGWSLIRDQITRPSRGGLKWWAVQGSNL
tara:strand:+ start:337 stop:564 length:228 start_codon:yes stop_codon:yes gene_type:complete